MSKKQKGKAKKETEPVELTEEQYSEIMEGLDEFENTFLNNLAGTSNYEVIPTSDEMGEGLTDKHYSLIKKECSKYGLQVIYSIEQQKQIVLFCPKTMKTGVILMDEQIH